MLTHQTAPEAEQETGDDDVCLFVSERVCVYSVWTSFMALSVGPLTRLSGWH